MFEGLDVNGRLKCMIGNICKLIFSTKYLVVLLGSISLFTFGCKVLPPVETRLREYRGMEIFDKVLSRNHGIKTYSARRVMINIVDDDQVINVRGGVRIKKDSVIMISVAAFAGIEAARIKLTLDSVRIIDRINNIYFAGSYEDSQRFMPFPVSFDFVQGFFFASAFNFIDEFENMRSDDRLYSFDDGILTVQFTTNFFNTETTYNYDLARISLDTDFMLRNIELLSDDRKIYAKLNYDSYRNYNEFYLPENIEMRYTSHNLPLIAKVSLGRIEINEDLTFPFSVPGRYTKIMK